MNVPLIFIGLMIFLTLTSRSAAGQTPFERTGQVFLVLENSNEIAEFRVDNSLQTDALGILPPGGLNALGFRRKDNFLYGINPGNNHLYKIGKNATSQDLGDAGLDNNFFYLAGDVSPDGNYLLSVGSDATGLDVHLAKTDLTLPVLTTTFVPLGGGWSLVDVAFDPFTGTLFGFDAISRTIVTIDVNSGAVLPFPSISNENKIFGLYFDAFGDLYAYGSAVYGIVDAFFSINKSTGKEKLLATGPVTSVSDVASCPFSVEMKNAADPVAMLPCSDVEYDFTLANGSDETFSNLDFEYPLPAGFHFAGFTQNAFGVPADTLSVPGTLRLENLTLPPGVKKIGIKISVGDVPKGKYTTQATLKNLPALYGTQSVSDNLVTASFEDVTALQVNRFDEDSLFYRWFICHGESVELDGTAFGNAVQWNTGATNPVLNVSQGGIFTLKAGNTCEQIVVNHDVTSASCPYTIRVLHTFVPDTLFPCDDVIFRFIFDNDSGEPRKKVSFSDTLPTGFAFKKILKNPSGGNLKTDFLPNVIVLEGLNLKTGKDTLDILVEVGDVVPGSYKNRGQLYNLPLVMGPIRLTDDPNTIVFDSSALHVLGTLADTLFFQNKICPNTQLLLDASDLGKTFLWQDGSTDAEFLVKTPGEYQLTLLDGCNPAEVFWQIGEGAAVEIGLTEPFFIHQGEEILLEPVIVNQGDSLAIIWTDPPGHSLSCLDCPNPVAAPLQNTIYELQVTNGACSDSATIVVEVDKTRRIFAANVFSPNDDGLNDFFYLQSPDQGIIHLLRIFDRWGNVLFSSPTCVFNEISNGWNGSSDGKKLPPGVYLWQAEIEFPDGEKKVYSGDVTIVR
ncbi:MAG: hypothetical protein OHK0019_09800 [Saprospiraceae bacterium]